MRKFLFLVCAVVLLSGCVTDYGRGISFDASTDKDVYYSGETMNISVVIDSLYEREGTIRVFGVTDSFGRNRVEERVNVSISQGRSEFYFDSVLPSCYGCACVSPGNYTLNFVLEINGTEILNITKPIELKK